MKTLLSRENTQRLAFAVLTLAMLATVAPIVLIVGYIVRQGGGALSWQFISGLPTEGMRAGGIWPTIVGTVYLTLGTALVAVPVGVAAAIYLAEYARDTALTRLIRLAIINLAGIPSVV